MFVIYSTDIIVVHLPNYITLCQKVVFACIQFKVLSFDCANSETSCFNISKGRETKIFDINCNLITSGDPAQKGLDRLTDERAMMLCYKNSFAF